MAIPVIIEMVNESLINESILLIIRYTAISNTSVIG